MSTARLPEYEGRATAVSGPVPEDGAAAPIRDRLAAKRQQLDASLPEAVDQAADILAHLHGGLCGEVASLAPALGRSARHLRGQLLGEHGLPLEDVCGLGRLVPRVVSLALAPLVAPARVPDTVPASSLGQAGAELARSVAAFLAELVVALEDGRVTLGELRVLDGSLARVESDARDARVALLRRRA